MSLNERLIGAGAVACTADTTDVFGDGSGIALYTMDYDASDASGSYDGTPTNVEFGVEGQINYGARFNGTSAYISTGGSIVNSLTSITVAGWFYTEPNTNYSYGLHFGTISTGGDAISISRWNNTAFGEFGAYTLYANIGSGNVDGNYTLNENTWYHIAITWTGTTMKFYVNGNLETTATTSSLSIPASGNSGYIGRYIINQSFNWKGKIDQLRIFNKALSSDEVSTLYAETACVYTCTTDTVDYPTTNVAYYKLDNSAEDETGNYDGTATNVNYTFGRFGQAAVFSSSNTGITNSNLKLNSTGHSVSMWINTTTLATGKWNICFFSDFTGFPSGVFGRRPDRTDFHYRTESGNELYFTLSNTNTWYHILATRDANGVKIYVNGSFVTSNNDSLGTVPSSSYNVTVIGSNNLYPNEYFQGSIDQVRIFSSALTSTQATELYEEYECEDTSTFNPVLYTGNGSTQYISNVGFEPDLVWIKVRSAAGYNHNLFDTVRGATKRLMSNLTNAEDSNGTLTSFDANGFFLSAGGDANPSQNMVAWSWKGGGDAVSNTDGTITSQVSANTDAGFSIVKTTSNSSGILNFGHGLDLPPELVITKQTDGISAWYTYNTALSNGLDVALALQSDGAAITNYGTGKWSSSNSVVGIGQAQWYMASNANFIAYCFHSVAGYSKIGSYSGSNSPITIYTTDDGTAGGSNPFEPAFIMTKRTNSPGGFWIIQDNKRRTTNGDALYPNSSAVESFNWNTSFNSNGFTISSNEAWISVSGGEYIYMAFA